MYPITKVWTYQRLFTLTDQADYQLVPENVLLPNQTLLSII